MTPHPLSFVHRYEPGASQRAPLLLLHGTGGDENDLLPLGRTIAPGASLLSPRGQVSEHGMSRFFRRLAEGIFDEDDLRRRVEDLARFVAEARAAYGIGTPIAIGFSNGANIAAATLLLRPDVLSGAVLFRAMTPFRVMPKVELSGKPILMLSGSADPIVHADDAATLASSLKAGGAEVKHRIVTGGHTLTQPDVAIASAWLTRHEARAFA